MEDIMHSLPRVLQNIVKDYLCRHCLGIDDSGQKNISRFKYSFTSYFCFSCITFWYYEKDLWLNYRTPCNKCNTNLLVKFETRQTRSSDEAYIITMYCPRCDKSTRLD